MLENLKKQKTFFNRFSSFFSSRDEEKIPSIPSTKLEDKIEKTGINISKKSDASMSNKETHEQIYIIKYIDNKLIKLINTDSLSELIVNISDDGNLVEDFKTRESPVLMSSSIGQELSDDTTQKLVIGGAGSRLVSRDILLAYPIWAKKNDSKYMFDFAGV